jgi:ankyrin repeat protein
MNDGGTEYIASALRAAARYGHTDLLLYLLSRDNGEKMALPADSVTLLHDASRGNHIQTVRALVNRGARCDIQDENGRTALYVSAETGSFEVTKFIVQRQEVYYGEDELKYTVTLDTASTIIYRLNVQEKDGNTPLHLAAEAGNTSSVLYLLSVGSDWRIFNTRGEYPLTLAARFARNDTVNLMLQRFSTVTCEEIMTGALTAAIVAGQVDTTALLLSSGAAVSEGENEKPIHIASRMRHREIVDLLLKYGASLSFRTDSGNTALHLASENGHLSLVKYLV